MTFSHDDLVALWRRVTRMHDRASDASGPGYRAAQSRPSWVLGNSVEVEGLRRPEDVEDDLWSLFIYVWSLKDRYKDLCIERGLKDDHALIVRASFPLRLCADIANEVKHGPREPDHPFAWTRYGPRVAKVQIPLEQSNIAAVVFFGSHVHIRPESPKSATVTAEIVSREGDHLADAYEVLSSAIADWECAFDARGFRFTE